jgi:ribosomal protein S18 acetylase RimI-like enzyme
MISYATSIEDIAPDQLTGFFADWPNPPSPEIHLAILKSSYRVVIARDTESGQIIGFINAISDGVLAAYIPLLEVLPDYRGQRIGRELVRRMLDELADLYMVDLVCDGDLRPFYEALGMKPGTAMMLRKYDRQSGSPP